MTVVHTIVGGLLLRGGSVLLGKRAPARTLSPDVWDVFGGHVEPGEKAEAALVRELDEELGIRAKAFRLLEVLDDPQRPNAGYPLFLVDDWEGEPRNRCTQEHTEIRWFSPEDLKHVPLAHPAYLELIAQVCCRK